MSRSQNRRLAEKFVVGMAVLFIVLVWISLLMSQQSLDLKNASLLLMISVGTILVAYRTFSRASVADDSRTSDDLDAQRDRVSAALQADKGGVRRHLILNWLWVVGVGLFIGLLLYGVISLDAALSEDVTTPDLLLVLLVLVGVGLGAWSVLRRR